MESGERCCIKWIASDIPRGLATGASEYNEKICLTLRFPAVLPEGVFNAGMHPDDSTYARIRGRNSISKRILVLFAFRNIFH